MSDEISDDLPPELGKIIWAENPLRSRVELTAFGKHYLKKMIYQDALQESIGTVLYGARKTDITLEKLKDLIRIELAGEHDAYVERFYHIGLNALQSTHCGDCTCVPASCSKCQAEMFLELSTTKGLRRHAAHHIQLVFNGGVSIDEALVRLRDYVPKANWEGWETHAERWKQQATEAYEWLLAYRDRHFPPTKEAGHAENRYRD